MSVGTKAQHCYKVKVISTIYLSSDKPEPMTWRELYRKACANLDCGTVRDVVIDAEVHGDDAHF